MRALAARKNPGSISRSISGGTCPPHSAAANAFSLLSPSSVNGSINCVLSGDGAVKTVILFRYDTETGRIDPLEIFVVSLAQFRARIPLRPAHDMTQHVAGIACQHDQRDHVEIFPFPGTDRLFELTPQAKVPKMRHKQKACAGPERGPREPGHQKQQHETVNHHMLGGHVADETLLPEPAPIAELVHEQLTK